MNSSTLVKLIFIIVPITFACLFKWSRQEQEVEALSAEIAISSTSINWLVDTTTPSEKKKKKIARVKRTVSKHEEQNHQNSWAWLKASYNSDNKSNNHPTDEIEPFDSGRFAEEYSHFWEMWNMNSPPMRDHEIQLFLDRAGATVAISEQAKLAASSLYRSFEANEVFQRYFIREILNRSESGKAQLLIEAEFIHQQERVELYNEMFKIYRNFGNELDQGLVEKAIAQINNDAKPKDIRPALHYLKNAQTDADTQIELNQLIRDSLITVIDQNENPRSVGIALQNLYRLNSTEVNNYIAIESLAKKPCAETVIETIHAIKRGHLELTSALKRGLSQAIERPNVTEKELKALQTLFTQGPTYSKEADYF